MLRARFCPSGRIQCFPCGLTLAVYCVSQGSAREQKRQQVCADRVRSIYPRGRWSRTPTGQLSGRRWKAGWEGWERLLASTAFDLGDRELSTQAWLQSRGPRGRNRGKVGQLLLLPRGDQHQCACLPGCFACFPPGLINRYLDFL